MTKTRVNFMLDDKRLDKIDKAAFKYGLTRSDVIRLLLDEAISKGIFISFRAKAMAVNDSTERKT